MKSFDQTLLEYLKAARENKPMKGGRNYKLQVTAGKSVSEEEVLEPKKSVTRNKKIKLPVPKNSHR